jgi:hypothetical protein
MRYVKALAAILAAIATALIPVLADGHITGAELINVAISAATAAQVYAAPNTLIARATKAVLAVIMAVLQAAVVLIADPHNPVLWFQVLAAAVGAAGIYRIPNSPPLGAIP